MVAILSIGMVVHPAGFKIDQVGSNDEQYGRDQHPGSVVGEKLFQYQENKAGIKQKQRPETVVVPPIAMP